MSDIVSDTGNSRVLVHFTSYYKYSDMIEIEMMRLRQAFTQNKCNVKATNVLCTFDLNLKLSSPTGQRARYFCHITLFCVTATPAAE